MPYALRTPEPWTILRRLQTVNPESQNMNPGSPLPHTY